MTLFVLYWKNIDYLNIFHNGIKIIGEDLQLDDLIRKLLKVNPNERITWSEYFEHPFFNKYEY